MFSEDEFSSALAKAITNFKYSSLKEEQIECFRRVSMFSPTLLSKSDKTMLSAVKQLLPVNSLFFVSVNKGMAAPAGK